MAQGGTGRFVTLKRIVLGGWVERTVEHEGLRWQAYSVWSPRSVPTSSHSYLFDAQFCKRMAWGFSLQGA